MMTRDDRREARRITRQIIIELKTDHPEMTMEAIALKVGVTRQRIHQILRSADLPTWRPKIEKVTRPIIASTLPLTLSRKRNRIKERLVNTGTYHEARGVDWLLVQDGSVLVGNRSYNDLETALATEV
jgi:transcriptional regulator with XRE-family HTH domain